MGSMARAIRRNIVRIMVEQKTETTGRRLLGHYWRQLVDPTDEKGERIAGAPRMVKRWKDAGLQKHNAARIAEHEKRREALAAALGKTEKKEA